MASSVAVRRKLAEFFTEHGVLTEEEYRAAENTPVSVMIAKRTLGTWQTLTRKVVDYMNSLEVSVVNILDDVEQGIEKVIDQGKPAEPKKTSAAEITPNGNKTTANK